MRAGRALEVACGEAHVSRELLAGRFARVDLFDQCERAFKRFAQPLAIERGPNWRASNTTMQAFEPDEGALYDLIVFRYCLGYIHEDDDAAKQLRRYAGMLRESGAIVLQDGPVDPEEAGAIDEGQKLRSQGQYEGIIKAARLHIQSRSTRILPDRLNPAYLWVLPKCQMK